MRRFVMPLIVLVALFAHGHIRAQAPQKRSPDWVTTPRWMGSFTITVSGEKRIKMSTTDAEVFHQGNWSIGGPFVLDRAQDPPPGATASDWSGETRSTGSLTGEYGLANSAVRTGYVAGGPPSGANEVRFQLSTSGGTYDLQFILEFDGAGTIDDAKALDNIRKLKGEAREFFAGWWKAIVPANSVPRKFNVQASFENLPLPDAFGVIKGSKEIVFDTNFHSPGPSLSGTVTWTLSPAPPSPYEVVLESDDSQGFVPQGNIAKPDAPGNDFRLRARVRKTGNAAGPAAIKANLDFQLEDVSKEKGVCANWPVNGANTDPDLKLLQDRNAAPVVVDSEKTAHTKEAVTEAAIVVSSFDFAASGSLRVKARDEQDRPLPVVFQGRRDAPARIPRDDNANGIADAWEERNPTPSTDAEGDDDAKPGGAQNGDGIPLFEEYRGFMVLIDAQRRHQRMDPRMKEMFIVDDTRLLNLGVWQVVTGSVPYRVDGSLTKAGDAHVWDGVKNLERADLRIVNPNSGTGGIGPEYAVHLVRIDGMAPVMGRDPNNPTAPPKLWGGQGWETLGQSMSLSSPKDSDWCMVWPDRIAHFVRNVLYQKLQMALADPASKDGKALAAAGLPPGMARQALEAFKNEANIARVTEDLMTLVPLHEVGHACGLLDHHDQANPGNMAGGVRTCPMRYNSRADDLLVAVVEMLLPQAQSMTLGRGPLCTSGDNCRSHFSLKDK